MTSNLVIPRWFATLLGFLIAGAVPWAFFISTDLAAIRTKLDAALIQSSRDISHLTERVERNERRIDNQDERLRKVETSR